MIEKLITKYIEIQLKNGNIQKSDISVYQYGYTLMIEMMLNVCFSFGISVALGEVKEVAFFLLVFIPLRSFCGGYHANKVWKCFFLSNIIVFSAVFMAKFVASIELLQSFVMLIMVVVAMVIAILSPVESEGRKLELGEKKKYKYSAWIILLIEILIAIFMLKIKMMVYFYLILMVLIIQMFSLLFALKK